MAVMLVVGMGNLAWMGGLALVGAVQKAGRWGRPLARATGAALFAAGVVLVVAR
jgi:predicted metal-binding membrane protein